METIKLLRKAYGLESVWLNQWCPRVSHSIFSKNLYEAPLCEKKNDQPWTLIMEMNINTVRAVIDDDRHLSTKVLDALLHIPHPIIHCILTEKLKMVHMVLTFVPHMLTSDQMWIHVENTSKFLGFIAEDSTYLNREVMYNETWVHHYDPLIKQESEHWKRKNKVWEKTAWQQKLAEKVMLIVFFNYCGTLYQHFKKYYLKVLKIICQHVNQKCPGLKTGGTSTTIMRIPILHDGCKNTLKTPMLNYYLIYLTC